MEIIKHILGFFFLIIGIYSAVGLVTYISETGNPNILFFVVLIIVSACLNLNKVKEAKWMEDNSKDIIIIPLFAGIITFFGLTFLVSSFVFVEYLYLNVDPLLIPLGAFFGFLCFKIGNKFHK